MVNNPQTLMSHDAIYVELSLNKYNTDKFCISRSAPLSYFYDAVSSIAIFLYLNNQV